MMFFPAGKVGAKNKSVVRAETSLLALEICYLMATDMSRRMRLRLLTFEKAHTPVRIRVM